MKKSIFCRIVSMALTLCLLMGCVPAGAVAEGGSDSAYAKVADDSTMDGYTEYFTADTTEYAGLVWTDKSVFTSAEDFAAATAKGTMPSVYCTEHRDTPHKEIDLTDEQSFLVALSAAASNKSISGYQFKPTDTVFVLDMSSSMWQNSGADQANHRIQDLIPAANAAIDRLLMLNPNNRIGVVLYSGLNTSSLGVAQENTTEVLLSLDHYSAENKEYLTLVDGGRKNNADGSFSTWLYHVKPGATLKNSSGVSVVYPGNGKGKEVNGSTYIQNGLYQGVKVFEENEDPRVDTDSAVQAGVMPMPILILMSDGAPSVATTNFAPDNDSIGSSNAGNGRLSENTPGIAFLAQLTASWTRHKIEEHYSDGQDSEELSFYTLGLNLSDSDCKNGARLVMEPGYTPTGPADVNYEISNTFNEYWEKYNNGSVTLKLTGTSAGATYDHTITKYTDRSLAPNYVDEYFPVSDYTENDLLNKFNKIIDKIELQSRYTPTEIEGEKEDPYGVYGGYVTFIDDIGEHMEIKDVKGLVLGDRLYSGEHMAQQFTAEKMQDWFNHQEDQLIENNPGYQLITAMVNRLGLDNVAGKEKQGRYLACALIDAAYKAGQLGPKAISGIGNSVGWYANADGEILKGYVDNGNVPVAFWDWMKNPNGSATGTNGEAAYRIRSYIFYDEMHDPDVPFAENITEQNSVYASVQVREHIQTGKVSLIWRIPSNLIPINEYVVEFGKDDVEMVDPWVVLIRKNPIQLVYEVGMKNGYRSYEIEETIRQMSGYQEKKKEEFDEWLDLPAEERHEWVSGSGLTNDDLTDINSFIKDENGSYYFYTNAFNLHIHPDVLDEHPSQAINTVSYFEPSDENERFRFTKKTEILIINDDADDDDVVMEYDGHKYVKYKGDEPTLSSIAEERYYFKRNVFVREGTHYKIITQPALIRRPSIGKAEKENDNTWYIPVGVIEYPQTRVQNLSSNLTETYEYSDIATVEIAEKDYTIEGIQNGDYIISSILGNNGRLKVTQDTGLAIHKEVKNLDKLLDEIDQDTSLTDEQKEEKKAALKNKQYTFAITRTDAGAEADNKTYTRVIEKPEADDVRDENFTLKDKIVIKAGETAHILGLAPGSTYTITEEAGSEHKLETITVTRTGEDGKPDVETVLEATDVEVKPGSQVYVTFENNLPPLPHPDNGYGKLTLRKIASHNYKYGFDIPMDAEFVFQVTFEKGTPNIYASDVLYDTDGRAYELDAQGVASVVINPSQEIVIAGLEEGTKVAVKEIVGPHESYVIEEVIAQAETFTINEDYTAELEIADYDDDYIVTVHNKYLDPEIPITGDHSRLILWTAMLGMCAVSALLFRKRREN